MPENENISIEALFKCALDLVCVASSGRHFLKTSPSWTSLLGWTEEELLATPILDFVHPKDRDDTIVAMSDLSKGQPVIDFENRFRDKEGEYHWLQWRGHCEENNPHIVYAVAREITEAKTRELRASNDIHLLEMAEQTARVGHWHLDATTGHLHWSNEVFKIYGRKPHKSNITLDDFIDGFVGKDQKTLWSLIQQATHDGSEINTELNLLRSDGQIRIVVVRAALRQWKEWKRTSIKKMSVSR